MTKSKRKKLASWINDVYFLTDITDEGKKELVAAAFEVMRKHPVYSGEKAKILGKQKPPEVRLKNNAEFGVLYVNRAAARSIGLEDDEKVELAYDSDRSVITLIRTPKGSHHTRYSKNVTAVSCTRFLRRYGIPSGYYPTREDNGSLIIELSKGKVDAEK
jgi:hypothetical protein